MIGYLSQLVWISSAIVVLLFLLGSIAYNLLYDRAFELTIILEAIAIPLMAQVRQSQGVLRGLGKPSLGQFLLLVAIPGVNLAVFVAVLSITGPTTLLAVSTYVVAVLAVFVAARLVTRKGLAPLKADVSGERKRYWRKSSGILGLGVVAFVLSDQLPALLTGILGSDAEVGLLDMARKFGMLTSVGLSVVSLPLGPILAELHARDDMVKFQSIAAKSTALAVVWSILLTAVFALAGPLVLRAINPDFAIAYTALLVISAGQVFSTAAGPVGMVLNMTGHERDSLRGVMSSLTTIIVLVVVLVPTMGHLGAAIGACAGAIVWNFVLTYYVRKRLGIAVHAFAAWERR